LSCIFNGLEDELDAPVVAPPAEDNINDGKVVDGPTVLAFVQLARTPHK
jgi:hypothetical protein